MILPARLKMISKYLKSWNGVADVGTDHALLPIYLANYYGDTRGKIIATDVAQGPLDIALRQVCAHKVADYITLRIGYGLRPIMLGEVDTVVIAGMGHKTVSEILDDDIIYGQQIQNSLKRLLLQANGLDELLVTWLKDKGYGLITQDIVEDRGKYYVLNIVEPSYACIHPVAEWLSRLDGLLRQGIQEDILCALGPALLYEHHPLLRSVVEKEVERIKSALVSITDKSSIKTYDKSLDMTNRLRQFEVVMEWL
jgi:tRNA (adenine22-N1)-methyltransferase